VNRLTRLLNTLIRRVAAEAIQPAKDPTAATPAAGLIRGARQTLRRQFRRLLPDELRELYQWQDGAPQGLSLFPLVSFSSLELSFPRRKAIEEFPLPPVANGSPDPTVDDLMLVFATFGADYCAELPSTPGGTSARAGSCLLP